MRRAAARAGVWGMGDRTIVIAAGERTLTGVDPLLRACGWSIRRLNTIRTVPCLNLPRLAARLEKTPVDTILLTSPAAVAAALQGAGGRRLRRAGRSAEWWAVGPSTAQALRRSGVRRPKVPARTGTRYLPAALARPGGRRMLYLRSDRAGPGLARVLRARGHRVLDRVAYRTRTHRGGARSFLPDPAPPAAVVLSSPSSLAGVPAGLGRGEFARWRRHTLAITLGPKSGAAARRSGFRRVREIPYRTPVQFVRAVSRITEHAAR